MKSVRSILAVGAGGFIGSSLRYAASLAVQNSRIPIVGDTLWINGLGCFALGLIAPAPRRPGDPVSASRLFFATGLCGGFTTMSAFTGEWIQRLQDGDILQAAGQVTATLILCLVLFLLGNQLARFRLSNKGKARSIE
jgi:CrcB protein